MKCPKCGNDMYLDIVDEIGSHYECPNCDFEICDTSIKSEEEEEDDDE
jgi:hypothetical protein